MTTTQIKKTDNNSCVSRTEITIRQGNKIQLNLFNYCFLAYYYLIKEIKKYSNHAEGILLDVGSGSTPYIKYFKNYVEKYLTHEHPDAIKDGMKYDYLSRLPEINASDNTFDTIVSFSVLEHVKEPFETIKEFSRVLKPGGKVIFSVPQYWHLHEEPNDFLRFTKYILKEKLENSGFEILHLNNLGNSFATVGQAMCNSLVLLFDIQHVKNIYSFISGKQVTNLKKSILYAIYKSPLILLSIILIPIVNLLFLTIDKFLGSPRDTLGYFIVAKKK